MKSIYSRQMKSIYLDRLLGSPGAHRE